MINKKFAKHLLKPGMSIIVLFFTGCFLLLNASSIYSDPSDSYAVYSDSGFPESSTLYMWKGSTATLNTNFADTTAPEGSLSTRVWCNSWAGWGVFFADGSHDLSDYSACSLVFWVKTSVDLKAGIKSSGIAREEWISSHGWDGTDTWQRIKIPILTFTSDVSQVESPFCISADSAATFFVDDVTWGEPSLGNHAPVIVSSPKTTGILDQFYQYDIDANDIDGDTLIYSLAQHPAGMTISPATGLISWTPSSSQVGMNPVSVSVSDGNGSSDEQSFSIVVTDGPSDSYAVYSDSGFPESSTLYMWKGSTATLDVAFSDITVPEGRESARISGSSWAGWGVFFTDGDRDLSPYSACSLVFWVKTSVDLKAGIKSSGIAREEWISSHGWDGTDTWQKIEIPVSAFSSDVSQVESPFFITAGSAATFFVDYVTWIEASSGSQDPVIISGPNADPDPVDENQTSAITVIATGEETLFYSWHATGGTISGSGNVVTYHPPDVNEQTSFTITVDVTDSRGGMTTGHGSIIVNPVIPEGTLIDPETGGVLTADNGKVILEIPPYSISEPTWISFDLLEQEIIDSYFTDEDCVVKGVELLPQGLEFNQDIPAKLTFILDEAEVPGTEFILVLYNSETDSFQQIGTVSHVDAENYSVEFEILHFSAYAALRSFVSEGRPIGGNTLIPLPDMFTGSFSHDVSISVPPGRKNVQPKLGLAYRSSNSNSWVGVGYTLNPGYIMRSLRLGPPSYDDIEDTFYFVSDTGSTELVHLVDNVYQAKIESGFTKYYKEGDMWKAVQKDGKILWFGKNDNARESSQVGTFSWYITEFMETNGNYIEFFYTKHEGKSYLSQIRYTGNEDTGYEPKRTVNFYLEPREDVFSSYKSRFKIATERRLKEIQVKVEDELVWRYVLSYVYSEDTHRSLLRSITQYGHDGQAFPTQVFTYQKANEDQ